jgi:recombination protein RecT
MSTVLSEQNRREYASKAEETIRSAFNTFKNLCEKHKLDPEAERVFIMQALLKDNNLLAASNFYPESFRGAIYNLATVGLSLNPRLKLCYFAERDGEVTFDILYGGLLQLAHDCGGIEWVRCVEVYSNDKFEYSGSSEKAVHVFNPFKHEERGVFAGVYVEAFTGKDYLIDWMTADDIETVRALSDSPAWVHFPGPMRKKAAIRRAYNMWPRSGDFTRLSNAVGIMNEQDGIFNDSLNDSKGKESKKPLSEPELVNSFSRQYDENQISQNIKTVVLNLINRALEKNCWSAIKDWVLSNMKDQDRAYALYQIEIAQNKTS